MFLCMCYIHVPYSRNVLSLMNATAAPPLRFFFRLVVVVPFNSFLSCFIFVSDVVLFYPFICAIQSCTTIISPLVNV